MIEEKSERERRLAEELKEKEDLTSDHQKKYNNQKEEAEHKTKRIQLLWQRLKVFWLILIKIGSRGRKQGTGRVLRCRNRGFTGTASKSDKRAKIEKFDIGVFYS